MSGLSRTASLESEKRIAGLYNLEETIGKGHFAVVKLARHVFSGERVAVKVIDKTRLDPVSKEHLFQEVMCMKLVQHPNVVRLYEVIDTSTKLYLVQELGDGGDLYDYILRHEGGLDEVLAGHYFRQIVSAISFCHELHVVHRDLKPENVVFFEKLGIVKVTDFGFSNKFEPGTRLETFCGSLAYSAPEILLGDAYDPPKVDVWSLGVILYMLVCGHLPFQEGTDSETLAKIMDCKYTLPTRLSELCCALISRLLVRDADQRASLSEILQHKWMGFDQGEPPGHAPLLTRANLSAETQADIISKMIDGNLSTRQEIMDALSRDEYSYLTATYFLLAERKLSRDCVEQMRRERLAQLSVPATNVSNSTSPTSSDDGDWGGPGSLQSSVRVLDPAECGAPEEKLRRFSMILEDEEEDLDLASIASVRAELESTLYRLTEGGTSRCGSGTSTGVCSDGGESDTSAGGGMGSLRQKLKRRPLRRSVGATTSSPQLLKNIYEEEHVATSVTAALDIDNLRSRPRSSSVSRKGRLSAGLISPTHARRLRRASVGSKPLMMGRSVSSDNSDVDADLGPRVRHDSDHSSDTDWAEFMGTGDTAGSKCAPIREEEEFRGVPVACEVKVDERWRRSESVEATPARSNNHKRSNFSLSSSSFSLSSLASSLRGSKVVLDAIRRQAPPSTVRRACGSLPSDHSSLHSLPELRGKHGRQDGAPAELIVQRKVKPRVRINCCAVS